MSKEGAEASPARRAARRPGRVPRATAAATPSSAPRDRFDLQLIIDSIPAMAWSARADGTGDFFNKRYLDYVGLSLGEVRDWRWTKAVHPDDIDIVMDCWARFSAAGTGGEVEARLRRHDGVYRWFSFRSNALCDADGTIAHWYGINIDIEEQKRTAIMLAGEQRLLELVASGQPLLEILTTLCDVIEQVSPDCRCEIRTIDATGSVYEHVVAPSLPHSLTAPVPGIVLADDSSPSGLAAALKVEVIADDIATDGRWRDTPFQALLLDHGLKSVWSLIIASMEGDILGTLSVYRTRTGSPEPEQYDTLRRAAHIASIAIDRFRAENELRRREFLLVTAERISETGSFSWDLINDKLVWSEQMYRIWEIEPGVAVGPTSLMPTVHPDDVHMVEHRLERMNRGLDNPENVERLVMPDGRIKWLSNSTLVFHHADGRRECVGVSQDITRRRLAEEAFDKLRSELAHVTRVTSLGELAASITHEVNQPLAGIITNASTCLRMLAADPPDVEGAIKTAQRSLRDGNRASEVVNRLRGLYRKQEFSPEPLDLNDATREVIAICAHDLQRRRITLTTGFDETLSPVSGDRIQLQQVVLNLILNAADSIDGADHPERRITVETGPDPDMSGAITLSVSDMGGGIPAPDLSRIFDAFYTTKSKGMGIGLSVSRSIVERHDGRIWAESHDGPGARFCLSLPCKPDGDP